MRCLLEIAPKAPVYCPVFLVAEARAILGGSGGMVARRIFEICTSQIAEMHRRVRQFGFFMLLAKRAHVLMVILS